MTAIVLPDIDRSTIEELKKRIPDLSEIELPSLPTRKEVSRTADQTIDRLLGRSRAPLWPWIAAGVTLLAVVGIVAAWFAWFRRPTWETRPEPWSGASDVAEQTTLTGSTESSVEEPRSTVAARSRRSTAASSMTQSSIGSAPYPIEEA